MLASSKIFSDDDMTFEYDNRRLATNIPSWLSERSLIEGMELNERYEITKKLGEEVTEKSGKRMIMILQRRW